MSSDRKYKCPYCDKRYTRDSLADHIERNHVDLLPKGYSPTRMVFNTINKKDHGTCVVCKKESPWNEKTSKYDRLCGDPKCTKTMRENAQKNHIRVYGKSTLLGDPYHQEKMLANRRISGTYTFQDGGKHTYTGSYEKKCLEFFDKVIGAKSSEVISPGPVLEYKFRGETRSYISDIYYVPYNLIIECKDGGDNPNTRNMPEYRAKQEAKEVMITNQGKYNYLRLTNNEFGQLLEVLAELKMNMLDNDNSKVVKINEAEDFIDIWQDMILEDGHIKEECADGVYMFRYEPSTDIQISPGLALTNDVTSKKVLIWDYDGVKCKNTADVLSSCNNIKVYQFVGDKLKLKNVIEKQNEFNNFYEALTENELLCEDQIDYDDNFVEIDFDVIQKRKSIIEATINSIKSLEVPACNIISEEYKDEIGRENMSNCDFFEDLDGYYIKNISTGVRTESVNDIRKITMKDIFLINNVLEEDIIDSPIHINQIDDRNPRDVYSNIMMPFFTSSELIDFGYYSGEGRALDNPELNLYDNEFVVSEWFKNHKYACSGIYTETYLKTQQQWSNIMKQLQLEMDISKLNDDVDRISEIKETMISLGWNPIMEYTYDNQIRSSNRLKRVLDENKIDIVSIDDLEQDITEAAKQGPLYPIYVVLVSGHSLFSAAIKKFTHSIYSHVAISMDEKMNKLYSYNLLYKDNDENKYSGFSIESIKNYGDDSQISIFGLFVSKKVKQKINKFINDFKTNIDKTSYSIKRVFGFFVPFELPENAKEINKSMICSQFVSTILNQCNMHDNSRSIAKTAPADIYNNLIYNNKAYHIFEGKVKDYKPKKVLDKLKILRLDVEIIDDIIEEAELPLKFDEEGNLLINRVKIMNPAEYEKEYSRIHKILLAAEKTKNTESMKYELAKLWFLNINIEDKLKNRKQTKSKKDYDTVRSKILNDFYKYLKYVNEIEPNFVFSEYYQDSIYNTSEYKISKSTVNMTIDTIKRILAP